MRQIVVSNPEPLNTTLTYLILKTMAVTFMTAVPMDVVSLRFTLHSS